MTVLLFFYVVTYNNTHALNLSFDIRVKRRNKLWLTAHHSCAIGATDAVWIVAVRGESSFGACERKSIRTSWHEGFAGVFVTFIVVVTVLFMWEDAVLVVTTLLLSVLSSSLLSASCKIRSKRKRTIVFKRTWTQSCWERRVTWFFLQEWNIT